MTTSHPTLYQPEYEHASCGLGFIAQVSGRPARAIVDGGLTLLENLAHRGASGSEAETGDGAGILIQIPHGFLRREMALSGPRLPRPGRYAVGMLFLSPEDAVRHACERELERIAAEEGQEVMGWRDVPVEVSTIGSMARASAPRIRQVFIRRGDREGNRRGAFERKLYVIRRRLHHLVEERFGGPAACYVVSLSARTLVYKGLLTGPQVAAFYPDLRQPRLKSALALVHSRFSTNTLGSWHLAHPYRYVAHNGEINSLRGNVNWMRARESRLSSSRFGDDIEKLRPVFEPRMSDSASFDNAFELLVLSGRSPAHTMMMMVPEAWENNPDMDPDLRRFYRYHNAVMEPWDGPAALAFTDGRVVGAALDRNGLRPARYSITRDGRVILASEEGALPVAPEDVLSRGKLGPGRMLLVDTRRARVLGDEEAKREVVHSLALRGRPDSKQICLESLPRAPERAPETASLRERQRAFGYTHEDIETVLRPMARDGKEPDGSMGTDTPLAILSQRPQLLFSYFKQLFAQVTNPPIDPLRESLVMSLAVSLGPEGNLLDRHTDTSNLIHLESPVLTERDLDRLSGLHPPYPQAITLSLLFPASAGPTQMGSALDLLCRRAEEAVRAGAGILVLSDRGIDAAHAPIPSLLATAAVHHHLVRAGVRTRTALVVEANDAREVHHLALLFGYGATAVCPTLALETVRDLAAGGRLGPADPETAAARYSAALEKGLLKVISKMGISTMASYCGAQIFEAVGLDRGLVDRHFSGTSSRVGGLDLQGIDRETLQRHAVGFEPEAHLPAGGEYRVRPEGESHQWNPSTVVALQRSVRNGDFASFSEFTRYFDEESSRLFTLRGVLDLAPNPIPLRAVEPAQEIVKRFCTGAMSFGSLSKEAHETVAVAMNRLGGKSNSGEGGEDPERYHPDGNGDSRRSAIKQVASGRFGVTAHYLVNADTLQIKMAQGSKPGEGGQLPGHKVTDDIARVRHSTPGVGLISPPPHHDIYSIEDLAQLIYDLKHVNPAAGVSVKLVSAAGVGTIAAGVAKAKADHITISGHDGGTGASPLSSIKHAGLPWELGLAETQQVLIANHLRGRVRLQVDGQLKTGRDVVVAALLGAEEFAFSTAPLVAAGCIMMRVCHLNTCPVGIATQDPDLRSKFEGQPEHVINYFFFLAEEVRRLMALLGFRHFDDMVGRSDLLRLRRFPDHPKSQSLDLSRLVAQPADTGGERRCTQAQSHELEGTLDARLAGECEDAVLGGSRIQLGSAEDPLPIRNTERSVGAMLSGAIARRHGRRGLPDDSISLTFTGAAGQSFGAWGMKGLTLRLFGEANDYVGKGLSGATIAIAPPPNASYDPEHTVSVGNVVLYGATSGELYVRGTAGERFAVRNSGAEAVVEGVGDHGCEYMTGGAVLVLGPTGRNFGAGMSGGTAFVLDLWGRFRQQCNADTVGLEPLTDAEDVALVKRLLRRHVEYTASPVASRILDHWHEYQARLIKVMPHDLKRVAESWTARRDAEKAV